MGRLIFLTIIMYGLIVFGQPTADDLLETRQTVQTVGVLAAAE